MESQKTIYVLEVADYDTSDPVAVTDSKVVADEWDGRIGLVTELKLNVPVDQEIQ